MGLSEKMQSMMEEIKAIKHLNQSIKTEMDNDISVSAAKKVALLISMIDNLNIPDIVCSFEEVGGMEFLDDNQRGLA